MFRRLEKSVREDVKRITVKATLDGERDRARAAHTTATAVLTSIKALAKNAQAAVDAMPSADESNVSITSQSSVVRQLLQNILMAQQNASTQEQAARAGMDAAVNAANNIGHTADAIAAGVNGCQAAEAAAGVIRGILNQANADMQQLTNAIELRRQAIEAARIAAEEAARVATEQQAQAAQAEQAFDRAAHTERMLTAARELVRRLEAEQAQIAAGHVSANVPSVTPSFEAHRRVPVTEDTTVTSEPMCPSVTTS